MTTSEWYLSNDGGAPIGPVATELVVKGILAGRVPLEASVARVGDDNWIPLVTVHDFAAAVRQANPPAPLPPPPPPGAATQSAWYVHSRAGTIFGPFAQEALLAEVRAGRLSGGVLVCGVGGSAWRRLDADPTFAEAFALASKEALEAASLQRTSRGSSGQDSFEPMEDDKTLIGLPIVFGQTPTIVRLSHHELSGPRPETSSSALPLPPPRRKPAKAAFLEAEKRSVLVLSLAVALLGLPAVLWSLGVIKNSRAQSLLDDCISLESSRRFDEARKKCLDAAQAAPESRAGELASRKAKDMELQAEQTRRDLQPSASQSLRPATAGPPENVPPEPLSEIKKRVSTQSYGHQKLSVCSKFSETRHYWGDSPGNLQRVADAESCTQCGQLASNRATLSCCCPRR